MGSSAFWPRFKGFPAAVSHHGRLVRYDHDFVDIFSYHTLRDLPHWWVRAWEGSMGLMFGTVCKDRALCFFQVVIVDDEIKTARASLSQIRRAAAALILQCAAGAESRGGIASNIGKHSLPPSFPPEESNTYFLPSPPAQLLVVYSRPTYLQRNTRISRRRQQPRRPPRYLPAHGAMPRHVRPRMVVLPRHTGRHSRWEDSVDIWAAERARGPARVAVVYRFV